MLLRDSKKIRNNGLNLHRSSLFWDYINPCMLIDLSYKGSKFTWSNMRYRSRNSWILERLDWFLAKTFGYTPFLRPLFCICPKLILITPLCSSSFNIITTFRTIPSGLSLYGAPMGSSNLWSLPLSCLGLNLLGIP